MYQTIQMCHEAKGQAAGFKKKVPQTICTVLLNTPLIRKLRFARQPLKWSSCFWLDTTERAVCQDWGGGWGEGQRDAEGGEK